MVPPPLANHLPLLQGALRAQREVTLSACRPAAVTRQAWYWLPPQRALPRRNRQDCPQYQKERYGISIALFYCSSGNTLISSASQIWKNRSREGVFRPLSIS